MKSAELLTDAFGRVTEGVHQVLDGLPGSFLTARLDDRANTIAWLLWHLARIEDDHVAGAAGVGQVWTRSGWVDRFGSALGPNDTGYGHDADQVAQVTAGADLLAGYFDEVAGATERFVRGLVDDDLDRIVDRRWDPPVTLGVRLVSVINDADQHLGQAAFIRGLLERGWSSG